MKCARAIVGIFVLVLCGSPLAAQTFSSGSTGADGALDLTSGDAVQTLQVPPGGVFNFTTVNIPSGRRLRFIANVSNSAVVILATGNVTIGGEIDVRPPSQTGLVGPHGNRESGPGGFWGSFPGGNGFGPGGGVAPNNQGRWVGPLSLVPIVGGSGGALENLCGSGYATGGSGGGGALAMASTTSIAVTGSITARGNPSLCFGGTSGAGGAIRLVAPSISVSGSLNALGGDGASASNSGVVRIEANADSLQFTGLSSPAAVLSAINPTLVLTAAPTLRIVSIAGFQVPAGSGTRPDTVDLLLPTQLVDPIPLVVQASNIPVGSQVILAINGSPSATAAPATLTGTDQSSTATVNITGLDRTRLIFLFASITFEVPVIAQVVNPAGPNHIAKLRIDASPGKDSQIAFLRRDGSEVATTDVPIGIRQLFGR